MMRRDRLPRRLPPDGVANPYDVDPLYVPEDPPRSGWLIVFIAAGLVTLLIAALGFGLYLAVTR